MTVSVFMRIQVDDFDTWLNPDPNAVAGMMKGQGVLVYSLNRNLDNPNTLIVHMQFADEDSAKSFVKFYEKAAMDGHGPTQTVQESWIGQVIETHSGTPT